MDHTGRWEPGMLWSKELLRTILGLPPRYTFSYLHDKAARPSALVYQTYHSSPLQTCFHWNTFGGIPPACTGECYNKHAYETHLCVHSKWEEEVLPGRNSWLGLASQVHSASSDLRVCIYLTVMIFNLKSVWSYTPLKTWRLDSSLHTQNALWSRLQGVLETSLRTPG